ncbi:MAG: hypothetical protein A3B23_01765 [Candidatus Colwellbacteria bacterium RIFCSPLOWO2_01_FULL_48_10]|uniref:DUF4190 domain-containing protein n=1 Tax=Candidatus Colwellbacteria bacterium RIFCSPLOWO2_01_FULL_48_10 TaxID=1797690 RepID=A0A1G1Z7I1_9BACT|nr:MAG: hypothetical protein A3B23_01765 [Candidatus Colwellbacteria bacterium RIFCSPLOWO2_01_FULL_48_10]
MTNFKVFSLVLLGLMLLVPVTATPAFAVHCTPSGYAAPAAGSPYEHTGVDNNALPCSINSVGALLGFINKIFGLMFGLIIALATVFLLYAAFLYVTSRGDEEKVDNAKNIIIYAVIALVIAAIAYAVPTIVQSFVK